MEPVVADIRMESGRGVVTLKGAKMRFSPYRFFLSGNDPQERRCLEEVARHLLSLDNLALCGEMRLLDRILDAVPELKRREFKNRVRFAIVDSSPHAVPSRKRRRRRGIEAVSPEELPAEIRRVFLAETSAVELLRIKRRLLKARPEIEVITLHVLEEIGPGLLPRRAFIPDFEGIYPIDIPEIEFLKDADLILIDCPSRNLDMMPNGLAYVHNALKDTGIKFQTLDLDPIVYHRYHTHRLLDCGGSVVVRGGYTMREDPWAGDAEEEWQKPETIEYFMPEIREVARGLVEARPKILALSVQSNNLLFSKEVVKRVRKGLPDVLIVVGGYSCYYPTLGPLVFPYYDYMVIGEGDLTVGPLVSALVKGERPEDIPGVISRFDSAGREFTPGVRPTNLDILKMPDYDWTDDLGIYRNYNHYQLTPITGSRGCRWSRCRFCAERFSWRSHSPKRVADEIEWLNSKGCNLFQFNESDFNGKPENVLAICDEIIRRGLRVKLTGQLRIDKRNDLKFFGRLKAAGFVQIRFGVDGWTPNTLRLQNKGYTVEMITRNLKDCSAAGIPNEVNIVIGVPGETEEDIDRTIDFIVENKPSINTVANINPLMLMHGSVYWEEPEKYGISFRGKKEEIYRKYPSYIPPHLWYCEDPYIDDAVRKGRFERLVGALYENGFQLGAYAEHVVRNMKNGKGAEASARPDACEASGGKAQKGQGYCSGTTTLPADDDFAIITHRGEFYRVEGDYGGRIVELKKDYSPYIRLSRENFHGYNVIEVKNDFYGIRHGYPFDKDMADGGGYEHGVCFKGQSPGEVERLVTEHAAGPDMPDMAMVDMPDMIAALGQTAPHTPHASDTPHMMEGPQEAHSAIEPATGPAAAAARDAVKFFRRAATTPHKLSIILLDWSVRESFHVLEYLSHQAVDRSLYEVVWIEFYDRRPGEIDGLIKKYERAGLPSPLDTWIAMRSPRGEYYHKHRMYNLGILNSSGDVLVFMDSDAVVKTDFIGTIISEFEKERRLALHFEEIRNFEKKFYPFNFPPIDEITGMGCVNANGGVPPGLSGNSGVSLKGDTTPLHVYNYGACFCSRREDLIRIGGADEHEDYLGHICGPYEMTLRLVNAGIPDRLHPAHFLYHVWHPNQGGDNNYCGPNNGKGVSTTAMEIAKTGRVLPLLENPEIRRLRLSLEERGFNRSGRKGVDAGVGAGRADSVGWR